MKKVKQVLVSFVCLALGGPSVLAADSYWDINGASPGAGGGAFPDGIWDGTTANWSPDPTGSSETRPWTSGDTAVFSAGPYNDAAGTFTVTVSGTQTAAGVRVEEGNVTLSGGTLSLNVAGGGTIDVASGMTLASVVAGGANNQTVTKNGGGDVVFQAANTYTGVTTVNSGMIVLNHASALGSTSGNTVVNSGGAVMMNAGPIAEPIVINGTGANGPGVLRGVFTGTWSGPITVGSSGATIWVDAGLMTVTGAITAGGNNYDVTLGGPAYLRLNTGTFNIGTGIITKDGWGSLQTEASITAGGINLNDGHLIFRGIGGSLNTPSATITVGPGADSIGNVRLTGSQTSPTVGSSIVLNHPALPIRVANASTFTLTGPISGDAGGLDVVATGTGTLVLNNNDAYGGNTTITSGRLRLGASGAIPNTPIIHIGSGATFDVSLATFTLGANQTIEGDGTIDGALTVQGTLAPGASAGTLTLNNDLNLASTAVLSYQLNGASTAVGGGINDLTKVGGILTLDGTLNVAELLPGGFMSASIGAQWRLFDYTTALVDHGLALASVPALADPTWYFELDTGTPGQVNLVLVPEPSTVVLGLLGGFVASCFAGRRRYSA
jgi:fibronectin-binding autotransporter adhesin